MATALTGHSTHHHAIFKSSEQSQGTHIGYIKSSTVSVTDTYPIKSIISSSSMPNNDVTKAGGSGDKDESFPQE